LENKIKSLIREKMQDKVSLHGVIFEVEGKGILLTGASGIGKTTAALDLIKKNNFWVADDIALIKKNKKDELIARGHTRIKNLVYTKKTGIVSINKLIGDRKVKNKIKLAAIIEVQRRDIISNCFTVGINEILRVKLPCLCVNMPLCSYFDKNLLQESLAKLTGVY
jgi:HPr kinase/phosphorylase